MTSIPSQPESGHRIDLVSTPGSTDLSIRSPASTPSPTRPPAGTALPHGSTRRTIDAASTGGSAVGPIDAVSTPATTELALDSASTSRATARPIGVLLVNLGTPQSPAVVDVRRYLREFLSDPDVVQISRALWLPILYGVVLPFRSPKSARLYERIWTAAGSPLLVNSLRQRDRLATELGPSFHIALGMRYGAPSLSEAIDELVRAGCDRIVALPMFPQYSTTTSGSVVRAIAHDLEMRRRPPEIVNIAPWHTNHGYIAALAARVHDAARDARIEHYVMSFHGVPASYVARGDPYREQCLATAQELARELGLADGRWSTVFQSRFGPQEWLRPYADEYVPELAARHKRVLLTTPGFAADCLETLEEIQLRLREQFLAAGGEDLVVVPALNDHPLWIQSLANLVRGALEPAALARALPSAGPIGRPTEDARP